MKLAQYRLLGRIIRGERLPITHYRLQLGAVRALARRRQIAPVEAYWAATPEGRGDYANIAAKLRSSKLLVT